MESGYGWIDLDTWLRGMGCAQLKPRGGIVKRENKIYRRIRHKNMRISRSLKGMYEIW